MHLRMKPTTLLLTLSFVLGLATPTLGQSANADLSGLVFSTGTLTPAFDAGTD